MTPPTTLTLTATCRTPTGTPVTHTINLHDDGTVTTPQHDNEPWADQALTTHYLDPTTTSPHACDWWAQRGTQTTTKPQWQQGYINGVVDVRDWKITTPFLHTHAAYSTFCHRHAITESGRITPSEINLTQAHNYITSIATAAMTQTPTQPLDTIIYDSHLHQAIDNVDHETFHHLVQGGFQSWRHIQPLLGLDLSPQQALDLYQAAVVGDPDFEHWYGGMPDSINLALQYGIPKKRLVPFFQRRKGNGPLVFQETHLHTLHTLYPDYPRHWLTEAIGTLPHPAALTEKYGTQLATEPHPQHTHTLLIHEAAVANASHLLAEVGHPSKWPNNWEYPTLHQINQARTSESLLIRYTRHASAPTSN